DGGESTCQANVCDGGLGGACLANDGTASGTLGTCVVQSEHGLSLCIPNGTGTSCNVDGGVGNDDPLRTGLALALFRQDVSDAPAFCGAGKACFGGDVAPRSNQTIDTCEVLCSTALDGGCGFGNACLVQDPNDTTWGFCAACLPARSTDTCYLDSDCCPGSECA